MKIGLLMPFNEDTANPADFSTAEQLGFESMWVPEHPILPANPKTPLPPRRTNPARLCTWATSSSRSAWVRR